MKFLLFNLAVAAALGYLFFADRGQVQETAGRMHDAARDLRTFARQAYDKAPQLVQAQKPSKKPVRVPEEAAAAGPTESPEAPEPAVPAAAAPKPAIADRGEVPQPPPVASLTPATAETRPIRLIPDPATAKRRREVLEGRPPRDVTPGLKPGERLMSPSERRKELLTLSEEMDLFYARSVSR